MADGKHISNEALLDELDYVLQKHTQVRRGSRSHVDFRFGNPLEGLESYAIPKGQLPSIKEKLLAVNTEIHPHGYMRFHGTYGRGKGRNKVEILETGKLSASAGEDGSRLLEISENAPKRRYKLVKINKGDKDNWLIIGLPAVEETKTASEKNCNFVSKRHLDSQTVKNFANPLIIRPPVYKPLKKKASVPEKNYRFIAGRFIDSRTDKNLAGLTIIQPLTSETLEKGLGGRSSLSYGLGMLFLNCRTFWMKDVPFDLDLVRLDGDFIVTEIQRMKGSFLDLDLPTYRNKNRHSVHALEVPAGYCESKGIKIGDKLRVSKGA